MVTIKEYDEQNDLFIVQHDEAGLLNLDASMIPLEANESEPLDAVGRKVESDSIEDYIFGQAKTEAFVMSKVEREDGSSVFNCQIDGAIIASFEYSEENSDISISVDSKIDEKTFFAMFKLFKKAI